MRAVTNRRRLPALLLWVCLALVAGCTRMPATEQTTIKPQSVAELQSYLLNRKPDLSHFRLRGPFAVTERINHELRLSANERFAADLYLAAPVESAPLLVFVHGYDSSKEAHAYQAMHAASWGLHSLAVQLPRKGPWVNNGRTLTRLVNLIRRSPELVDKRIDVNKIILVGHSFGGAAVSIAMGEGAPALGGILLDPAAVGRDLPKYLQQITKPVIVLGADEEVAYARNRDFFYRYVRSGVAEVSIKDAAHEDAQYPSEHAVQNFGIDPHTTEELQITFVSALTSAAISLAFTGGYDYAWKSFEDVLKTGKFYNWRKK